MAIALIVAVPGVVLLLLTACAGLVAGQGRKSDQPLVAPQNADFGEASRLMRAEATRERARADLRNLTSRKTAPALALVADDAAEVRKPAQRAA
jgi:hypothetical protein